MIKFLLEGKNETLCEKVLPTLCMKSFKPSDFSRNWKVCSNFL